MAITQNTLLADIKSDLYGTPFPDGWFCALMGETARNDTPIRYYQYYGSSTAADDGENVLKPTSVSGAGRWIKQAYQEKQPDYTEATTTALDYILHKPTIPSAQQAYEGLTLRSPAFPVILSATVASGVAVFNLTTNGLSGGTAIFPTGIIQDSLQLNVNDATAAYQMAYAFSNANKTVTITANKLTTSNILTGVLGQASANGAVVKMQIWGY
jgi:hypothetical protein